MRHIQPQICQHGFVVLFFLLSLPGKGADRGQTPSYTLSAQSVASGLCVHIPCTFTVPAGSTLSTRVTGIWKRTDTPDIVAASTEASMVSEGTKGRFTLTGKVHEGDCSFSISNAQPADQGEYEFLIEDGSHKYSYTSYKLSVSVTDLPEPTIFPVVKLIAGKPITLTCTAHPAPQGCKGIITWGGRINIENIYNYEREDQAGKVTSISDITVTPSQREHNSPLTCTVTYSGVSTNSSITLDVQYPPSLTITVPGDTETYENKSVTVIEGDTKLLRCEVNSNPEANVSWGRGDGTLNTTSGQRLILALENVSVADGVTYTCLAWNTHGSVSGTVSVTVVSPANDTTHPIGFTYGGIVALLLAAIVIIAGLVMRYKKKRRPPGQAEENRSSSPNNNEVIYSKIKKRKLNEPNMGPNSPNEGESPDEDLQYVSLDISRSKPRRSSEPQETLYSEVKGN